MNVSVGELVDRLSIVNVKLFQVQQNVIDWGEMPEEEFAKVPSERVHKNTRNLHSLNSERNRLIAALNERFGEKSGSTIKLT